VSKIIQQKIDAAAKRRKYWRELSNALGATGGSVVVEGLKARISAKAEEALESLKVCDPKDPIVISRLQTTYTTCKEILLDFDVDVCNKQVRTLDDQITKLNGELKKDHDLSGFSKMVSIKGGV
jgi:hypothetical protein